MFKFGIEHEVAFLNEEGEFVDFANITYEELNKILETLPKYPEDKDSLRVDRFDIMKKRWYVEGYERFNDDGSLKKYLPKGVEIRTSPHSTIAEAVMEFEQSFELLKNAASKAGLQPVWVSFHPFKTEFHPEPPFSKYEQEKLEHSPEDRTEYLVLLSFGPDINISWDELKDEQIVDIGQKLTYYSPFIVPFSFSSPFYNGQIWEGLSVRTFIRTGDRHAARVFITDPNKLLTDNPLTRIMRIPIEKGRIEYKAFDSCKSPELYAALLALIKGLVIDTTLLERAENPDKVLHQLSAKEGFSNQQIYSQANAIMEVVKKALENDSDRQYLKPLEELLEKQQSPVQELIEKYQETGSIKATLIESYGK